MNPAKFRKTTLVLFTVLLAVVLVSPVWSETLTLPLDQRPDWLRRDGIVMAGSWEPLFFRVRRDGSPGYTPTPEQRAAYLREHSPEMTARLKRLGVNFIMMHCYKGAGLEAERESMADAVRFAKHYHDAGLHVGTYTFSGTMLWDMFFREVPQAKDWVLLDKNGKMQIYGRATYRYRWNRNHPEAIAFYRKIVRFAVEEIGVDLVHFDNFSYGPGRDANSVQRFRQYLRDTFTPEQLKQAGITRLDAVEPPTSDSPLLVKKAWPVFCCKSLAASYHGMARYARSLRKDVLVECNPQGVGPYIHTPIDHGHLLQGGEAFWDESRHSGFHKGRLQTRIRTYKVARRMNNMAFAYTSTPLEMAEAMAFNLDCLGCICWFEYGKIVSKPGSRSPVSPEVISFIRFFHERRDLLREADVVADVAVLRNFPSQVLADRKHALLTNRVEDALIRNRACFQIIYDSHLDQLNRYRALVLAGCVALSDEQINQIKRYVEAGGRLCIVGAVATHDEWLNPRKQPGLGDLPPDRVVRIDEGGDLIDAARRACGGEVSLSVRTQATARQLETAPDQTGLCVELTEQADRRLVHLVNYRSGDPAKDVAVRLRLPHGKRAKSVKLASPERKTDLELPFEQEGDVVAFTVPKVNIYEIAVVTMQ